MMTQCDHEAWNTRHFPGTRQLCVRCDATTGRCEDDGLYADADRTIGPLCEECFDSLLSSEKVENS